MREPFLPCATHGTPRHCCSLQRTCPIDERLHLTKLGPRAIGYDTTTVYIHVSSYHPPPATALQGEQKPGAYSIPGAGGRAQSDSIPYTVTVPNGVRPGQEFQVMAGGLPMVVSTRKFPQVYSLRNHIGVRGECLNMLNAENVEPMSERIRAYIYSHIL